MLGQELEPKQSNQRYVNIYKDGQWGPNVEMLTIKAGDIFRVFDSDGTPVDWNGKKVFIAASDTINTDVNDVITIGVEVYVYSNQEI